VIIFINMQTLLTSEFNITDVESFRSLLTKTGGVVAGSAVLAAKTGTFTPNDLDIWIPYNDNVFDVYTNALLKLGYKIVPTSFTVRDWEQYANDNGKVIQVICTLISPIPIIDTFDFDICQFYWNAETDTISGPTGLEGPDRKIQSFRYIGKSSKMDENTMKRKEKYETRGFVFAQ
jgi:hypothetical protein